MKKSSSRIIEATNLSYYESLFCVSTTTKTSAILKSIYCYYDVIGCCLNIS